MKRFRFSKHHLFPLFVMGVVLFTTTACSMTFNSDKKSDSGTPDVNSQIINTAVPLPPTPYIIPLTPIATFMPPDPTATSQPVYPSNCSRPYGWDLYYVQSGDTLYKIAGKTGAEVEQLQAANCITDINLIEIGQELWVPSVTGMFPPTAIPPVTDPVFVQTLPDVSFTQDPGTGIITAHISVGPVIDATNITISVQEPGGRRHELVTESATMNGAMMTAAIASHQLYYAGVYTFYATATNQGQREAGSDLFQVEHVMSPR